MRLLTAQLPGTAWQIDGRCHGASASIAGTGEVCGDRRFDRQLRSIFNRSPTELYRLFTSLQHCAFHDKLTVGDNAAATLADTPC